MKGRNITRRSFLVGTAASLGACVTSLHAQRIEMRYTHKEKLNIAGIGVGGMGNGDIRNCASENIMALCDVDWERAASTFNTFPAARKYKDFREMLEVEKDLDAVVISTPDHTHAVAALAAMKRGLHVRVQKPLTWSVEEARILTKAAREFGVVTAMGNQGHSGDGVRQMCEILWSDAIGFVHEAHIWTNRPVWPQGIPEMLPEEPVPDYLDWDLWLGPAPERPYNAGYAPFKWRGWWDFGCGALGDMGCHIIDPAYWALQLGVPESVECIMEEGGNEQTGPTASIIKYVFPERTFKEDYPFVPWYGKTLPPVTVYWYDGDPERLLPWPEGVPRDEKLGDGDNGSYFVGDKGIATTGCYGGDTRLIPSSAHKDFRLPEPYIPRVPDQSSYMEWINGCKGGTPPSSGFDYAGPFTETVLLGNLAVRAGQGVRLDWDEKSGRVSNIPEMNKYLTRNNREGWDMSF